MVVSAVKMFVLFVFSKCLPCQVYGCIVQLIPIEVSHDHPRLRPGSMEQSADQNVGIASQTPPIMMDSYAQVATTFM